MQYGDRLFWKHDIHSVKLHRCEQAKKAVDALGEGQFLASTDEQLIAHLAPQFAIAPVVLREEEMTQHPEEADLPAERYDRFGIAAAEGIKTLKGVRIIVRIPFDGEPFLFTCKGSTFSLSPPHGVVRKTGDLSGILNVGIEGPDDSEAEELARQVHRTISGVMSCLDQLAKDLASFDSQLRDAIISGVGQRRERLSKHAAISKALNIPLARNPNAPAVTPVALQRKTIPPLPSARKPDPEYGIEDRDYAHILDVIRHEGRTFEATPGTFAKHDEEELRDIMLAHLNGHYRGQATGEAFRKQGKTDIRIEFENRAAFVAECKNWGGEKVVQEALSQLISRYLTWRDCKAALVLFNLSVGGFSEIQGKVPGALKFHPQFVREIAGQPSGEWRVVVKNPDDPARQITVHVFLFNLYTRRES